MGRVNHLLSKTLKPYIIYTFLVMIVSIPVYYYLVDTIWLTELDEHNEIIAERTEAKLNVLDVSDEQLIPTITLFNKMQPGALLEPTHLKPGVPDSVYSIYHENAYKHHNEVDRFRGLRRIVTINGKSFSLTVETNVEETHEIFIYIASITLSFFTLLAAGFLLLNKRLSVKLWEPFRNTLKKLKGFDLYTTTPLQFESTNISEFEELNDSLQKLITHTIAVYKAQQEFTGNASHELQTPLAIIKNKISLLLQHEELTERQYEIIEDINYTLSRITRINKNLLLLTKLETKQFDYNEMVNISQLVQQSLELLQEYAEDKQISITQEITNDVITKGNSALMEVLIQNLILNAIRHTPEQGQIKVKTCPYTLLISNSGIQALQTDNIFGRFSQKNNKGSGGGLGLSIIKEICNHHGWQVSYSFTNGEHEFLVKMNS